jgi:hypothetical protein
MSSISQVAAKLCIVPALRKMGWKDHSNLEFEASLGTARPHLRKNKRLL